MFMPFVILLTFILVFCVIICSEIKKNEKKKDNKKDKKKKDNKNEKKKDNNVNVPTVSFPFKNFFDEKGEKLNIILISAPFREIEHEKLYKKYKKMGLHFCGISSYLDFPNKIDNPFESTFHEKRKHNYPSMVSTWLSCFRKKGYTDSFSHLPHILFSEADLKDTQRYKPDLSIKKEYDFIYICLEDNKQCSAGWQSYNRNWELAKKCLKIFCSQFGLKGLLVGRTNCDITDLCDGMLKIVPFLPFKEFQIEIQKSRFIFVPNISDASPRVITESLSYDVPVLMNKNILGGWHHLKEGVTGEFFTDENDIADSLEKLFINYDYYTPRQWFINNSGKEIKGKELATFLKKNYPNINNKKTELVTITI